MRVSQEVRAPVSLSGQAWASLPAQAGTGEFLGIGVASQSGLWKISQSLCRYRCRSSRVRCWFSKPRVIIEKPGDSESHRVTAANSFLIPLPHFPTSISPPPSPRRPRPGSGFLSSQGHLFPSAPGSELAGTSIPSPPRGLGWGKRITLSPTMLGFGFRGPRSLPFF